MQYTQLIFLSANCIVALHRTFATSFQYVAMQNNFGIEKDDKVPFFSLTSFQIIFQKASPLSIWKTMPRSEVFLTNLYPLSYLYFLLFQILM